MSEIMTEHELSSPTSTSSSDDLSPRKTDKAKYKKSNKPMMEKKRRARINSCLNQLKSLVLQAMKKDNSQYSKLEKADILELTVRYLKNVQKYQLNSMTHLPDAMSKYRAGFNECANEVVRYLAESQGVNDEARTRIFSHLATLLSPINAIPLQQTHVPILPQQTHVPILPAQLQQVQHHLQQQQQQQQQQQPYLHQLHLQQQQPPNVLFAASSQSAAIDANNNNNNKSSMPHPAFLASTGSNLDMNHVISGSPTAFQSPIMAGSNGLAGLQFPYVTTTGAGTQLQLLPNAFASGHVALVLAPQNIPAMAPFGPRPQNCTETISIHPAGVSSLDDCKTRGPVSDSSVPSGKKRPESLRGDGASPSGAHHMPSMASMPLLTMNLKQMNTSVPTSLSTSSGVISRGYGSRNNSSSSTNNCGASVVRATSTWRPW